MSVTRGQFLKELGKSLPGMVLGTGMAGVARKVIGKMAAAAQVGELPAAPSTAPTPAAPPTGEVAFIHRGPDCGNRVALTFDDGPTPGVTDRILDELKRRNLRATFFMIGENILAAPDLARRVRDEGHDIAHHTFTHPNLTSLPDARVTAEIEQTLDAMREVLGHTPRWFRPPFGALRRNQTPFIARHGMRVVFWSVDPRDWSRPGAEKIATTILSGTQPGAIVLCHDVHEQTVDALAPVLDGFAARELKPVTLSELLKESSSLG